jgi:hypothetical protein
MRYGKLTHLATEESVEGYYINAPTTGQPFTLHGNPEVLDRITGTVQAVVRIPDRIEAAPIQLARVKLPPSAKAGDLVLLTPQGHYLLQTYRPPVDPRGVA